MSFENAIKDGPDFFERTVLPKLRLKRSNFKRLRLKLQVESQALDSFTKTVNGDCLDLL